MNKQNLNKLFIDELADMYSAETQIINLLPKLIKLASLTELKNSLNKHLTESRNQAKRIKKIFTVLGASLNQKTCKGMQGIIHEAEEIVKNKPKSATLDAAIISAAQKIEHYEIASYGTLRSFAKHLSLKNEVAKLLQENLNEEGAADKKLTKIADGTFFVSGVNKQAAKTLANANPKSKTAAKTSPKTKSRTAKAKKTTTARKTTAAKKRKTTITAAKKSSHAQKRTSKSPALAARKRSKSTSASKTKQTSTLSQSRASLANKLKNALSQRNRYAPRRHAYAASSR